MNIYGTTVLTPREEQVCQLITQGYKNKEIAEQLGTTDHVIKNYLRVIFDKSGMSSRLELALWWIHKHVDLQSK